MKYLKAANFIKQYYSENKLDKSDARLAQVKNEIEKNGYYYQIEDELAYGCKLAWRNSNRCIGRLYWKSLKLKDRRGLHTVSEVYEALESHIKYAYNNGKIRSVVSVFDGAKVKIWNQQLIRYAGYKLKSGEIIGDPDTIEFTHYCIKIGWKPPYGDFDVLPAYSNGR